MPVVCPNYILHPSGYSIPEPTIRFHEGGNQVFLKFYSYPSASLTRVPWFFFALETRCGQPLQEFQVPSPLKSGINVFGEMLVGAEEGSNVRYRPHTLIFDNSPPKGLQSIVLRGFQGRGFGATFKGCQPITCLSRILRNAREEQATKNKRETENWVGTNFRFSRSRLV